MPRTKKKTPVKTTKAAQARPDEEFEYVKADGSIDGEKLLALVTSAPGASSLMQLNIVIKGSNDSRKYHDIAKTLVKGLTRVIAMAAFYGDAQANTQLKAIEKLIKPAKFELPISKIQELVDRYETSPQLARGWALLKLMSSLSWFVKPLRTDRPFSPDQPIVVRDTKEVPDQPELMKVIRQYWKPNTTLQSLAICAYLRSLQREGTTSGDETINERTLKRDLARVREWEQLADENEKQRRGREFGQSLGDNPIFWCDYSEGWKTRKKKRHATGAQAQNKKGQTKRGAK